MKGRKIEYIIDILVAAILGLMAIICFILQVQTLTPQTTPKEVALFNILQFILTAGFGWFSTRALSRKEFEDNLKKFALSALRRISDIDSIICRLKLELNNMLSKRKDEDGYCELNVISAIIDDTKQMAKSSIRDWADVIGDELVALQEISSLEDEKEIITSEGVDLMNKQNSEALKNIDRQIKELRARLPSGLILPKESFFNSTALEKRTIFWLKNQHNLEKGLILKVASGASYGNYEVPLSLKPREALISRIGGDRGLDVFNMERVLIGRILNGTPFKYEDFVTLMEGCYGTLELKLEFIEIVETYKKDGYDVVHYAVRVDNSPSK